MNLKLSRYFLCSASVLLLATGLAKIISSFGTANVLLSFDPVFGLPFRLFFLVAGVMEIAIGIYCLSGASLTRRFGIVAWVGTLFLGYRLAMLVLHYKKPCACLGNMTEMLNLSPHFADLLMKTVLGYLLVGGYSGLFWLRRRRKETSVVAMTPEPGI